MRYNEMNCSEKNYLVAAFYKFARLDDPTALRQPLLACCRANDLRGTILLAAEGINGTVAGAPAAVAAVFDFLRADPRFADLRYRESFTAYAPFQRLKVKLKKEIVTMGRAEADPTRQAAARTAAADWNRLISADDVLLLDVRNHYEHALGTFANAVSPATASFREFPAFVEREMDADKTPRVAMFCTGGIRCEKAGAWLLQRGFREVYQLDGGILNYLSAVPAAQSLWRGACFVFDERVALDHRLQKSGGA